MTLLYDGEQAPRCKRQTWLGGRCSQVVWQKSLGRLRRVLLNEMMDADPPAYTPSSYLFRQACGLFLEDDKGNGYDGEKQGECMEFFEKLLQHLDMEDLQDRGESSEVPSLVRELLGVDHLSRS